MSHCLDVKTWICYPPPNACLYVAKTGIYVFLDLQLFSAQHQCHKNTLSSDEIFPIFNISAIISTSRCVALKPKWTDDDLRWLRSRWSIWEIYRNTQPGVLIGSDWRITKLQSESTRFNWQHGKLRETQLHRSRWSPRIVNNASAKLELSLKCSFIFGSRVAGGNSCNRTKCIALLSLITEPLIDSCKFNLCTYGATGKKLAWPPIPNWWLLKCPT